MEKLEKSRELIFVLCRDPHSVETLERFGQCIDFFLAGKFTDKDVNEAKLATFQKVQWTERRANVCAYLIRSVGQAQLAWQQGHDSISSWHRR